MKASEGYKKCHVCAEDIKVKAFSCRYCGETVAKGKKIEGGSFVKIKLEAENKTYYGDIYLTDLKCRTSDIMNDERKFIPIVNTTQEVGDNILEIGYLLLNKSIINWIYEDRGETGEKWGHIFKAEYTTPPKGL